MANEVFVSYSQPDRACAFELVTQLEAGGVGCWIAPRDIAPAADWAAAIIEAISNARIMVLVFSASSNASPQVRREVERAVHKQVRILPFRIENVLPSQSLEYFLSAAHWLDAFPPPHTPHYKRLCEYLCAGPNTGATATLLALDVQTDSAIGIDAWALQSVERALAQYIGPIARLLTKRAAARTADVGGLCAELAREMQSDRDRAEFLDSCRHLWKAHDGI
jgi:TIR domain